MQGQKPRGGVQQVHAFQPADAQTENIGILEQHKRHERRPGAMRQGRRVFVHRDLTEIAAQCLGVPAETGLKANADVGLDDLDAVVQVP
jgi:hypothetical protein